MNRLKNILAGLLALTSLGAVAQVKVTAKVDSIDVIQGALRRVDVEVVQPEQMNLRWLTERPADARSQEPVELIPGVEVNSSSEVDTVNLGSGRLQLNRTLLIQPWDSGEFVIPGIALVAGEDTFRSSQLVIKVFTADVDTMTTIHSWGPAVSQSRGFFDWVPDWIADYWWAYVLGLLLIAGAVTAYIIKRKGGFSQALKPVAKPVPPYEKAME